MWTFVRIAYLISKSLLSLSYRGLLHLGLAVGEVEVNLLASLNLKTRILVGTVAVASAELESAVGSERELSLPSVVVGRCCVAELHVSAEFAVV